MRDIIVASKMASARPVETQVVRARPHASSFLRRLPPGLAYVLALGLTLRLVLSLLGAWVLTLHPLRLTTAVRAQYLGQQPLHDALLAPWQRFDALWYVHIAIQGYSAHGWSTAYLPVYPLLIRLLSAPLGLLGVDVLGSALLVSTLSFLALLYVFYLFVAGRHGDATARRAVLLLCVFPTAFFMLAPYTESTYLFLTVSCFLATDRDKPLLAGSLAFLAALTRLQGAVLVLPLLWLAVGGWRRGVRDPRPFVAAAAPLLALALYNLFIRVAFHTSSVTATFTGQVHQHFALPWETLGNYAQAIAAHHFQLFSSPTGNWADLLNIILALGVLGIVLFAREMLGLPLWLYSLATWGVVLSIHQSTARYMLTVFPVFIVVAVKARGRWAKRVALLICLPLMLFMAGEFVRWSFVG